MLNLKPSCGAKGAGYHIHHLFNAPQQRPMHASRSAPAAKPHYTVYSARMPPSWPCPTTSTATQGAAHPDHDGDVVTWKGHFGCASRLDPPGEAVGIDREDL